MRLAQEDTFSIIIPFQEISDFLIDCISGCLELDYDLDKYEITLLPDGNLEKSRIWNALEPAANKNKKKFDELVKVIPTGKVNPGKKRNIGMKRSKARYLACIDSDASPDRAWLRNSLPLLRKPDVGIVGGPNKEPEKTSYLERLAIKLMYLRIMTGRLYSSKKSRGKALEYSDMAASNFIIKGSVAEECGYFDEDIFPCEDSVLCFRVINRGYKILYSPDVIVSHHRRPLFWNHLVKIKETAEGKSEILKNFKENYNPLYLMPTVFLFCVISGLLLSFLSGISLIVFAVCLSVYFSLVLLDCISNKIYNPTDLVVMSVAAFLTHLFYGYGFFRGMMKSYIVPRAGAVSSNP